MPGLPLIPSTPLFPGRHPVPAIAMGEQPGMVTIKRQDFSAGENQRVRLSKFDYFTRYINKLKFYFKGHK
jgi:hypothetical protein